MADSGVKHDSTKDRWDILPMRQMRDVVRVLTFGAAKYAPDNWQRVADGKDRYFAAAMRHLAAWREGEQTDTESGMPHVAHAVCCLLFLAWFDDNAQAHRG